MSERHIVGTYATYEDAERTLAALAARGFDRTRMSIVSPHVHQDDEIIGFVSRGAVASWGCVHGALWGMGIGVLVAFLTRLPIPSGDPTWLRLVVVTLLGSTLGGSAGLLLGGLSAYSLAPRFFITPDVKGTVERFALVLDDAGPGVHRARDVVLTLERQGPSRPGDEAIHAG